MPGIGMGDKYSWTEPPTFNGIPGEYDYMSGASSYKPASIEQVKNAMNDILDSISSSLKNYIHNMFYTVDLPNLNSYWNTLFLLNDEPQVILEFEKICDLGDEIENGLDEVISTVNSYFDDAKNALASISESLDLLEENAAKIAEAKSNTEHKNEAIREAALLYLECVGKYGKQYTKSDLSSIGKWVY